MSHTEADLVQLLHTGPFHLALRTALAVRGLPLQRVQHHLAHRGIRVGVTSLSYWQQGARRPQRPESLKAVRALEEVLQLPGNSLLRLLSEDAAGRAEVERPAGRSYRSLVEASGSVEELLAELESCGGRRAAHGGAPRAGTGRGGAGAGGARVAARRAGAPGRGRPVSGHPPRGSGVRSVPGGGAGRGELPHRAGAVACRDGRGGRGAALRRAAAGRGHAPVLVRVRGRHGGSERGVRARVQLHAAGSTCFRCTSTRRRFRCGAGGSPRPRRARRAGAGRS